MILCCSSVNSTYPKCVLSFCKRVISTSGTKHFIGKAETSLNWANFGTSHRMLLRGHFQRSNGVEKETRAEKTNTAAERHCMRKRGIQKMNRRAATLCLVQWWWGLHMRSIKHLEALVIYYWQMQKKATSVRRLEKRKKPTNIHNNQAMLLHKTKAPLSQICLNFWQQRKLNNMAFFFFFFFKLTRTKSQSTLLLSQ